MMREAIRQLKRREGVLIVLDEADKLSDQVLHFFITIYNKLEDTVGIVLCATQYLKKRIERGVVNNRKGYKEIYSRIGRKFIPMPVVNRGDIKAVCTANGLEDRREIERIIDDADNDLRRVKRLVWIPTVSSSLLYMVMKKCSTWSESLSASSNTIRTPSRRLSCRMASRRTYH